MKGLDRLLAPLARRVALMIGRGVVQLTDDNKGLQVLQVTMLADELRDGVERFQEYGITSRAHPGAEVAYACVAGSRDHVLVVAVDDRRYRLALEQDGEVALYDDLGQKVHLTRSGIRIVSSAGVTIDTPEVATTGSVRVGTGASGSFTTPSGQTVTVADGIVINIF